MLRALLATRLKSLWFSMFSRMRQGKISGGKKIAIGLFAIYVFAAIMFSLGGMLYGIADAVAGTAYEYLIFLLAGTMALTLSVLGSVFTAQKHLFDASDNELLLSMPIPMSMILMSRLLMLWVLNQVYTLLVMIAAAVVYALTCTLTLVNVLTLILATLLLPLLALAISCLLAFIFELISSKMHSKTAITYILTAVFLAAYFLVIARADTLLKLLIEKGPAFAENIRRFFPPLYLFAVSITMPTFENVVLLILWTVLPMVLAYVLLSKNLLKLMTTKKGARKIVYRAESLKTSSPSKALLNREWKRFFTLPIYVINSTFGVILEAALAAGLLLKGSELTSLMPELPAHLFPAIVTAALTFMGIVTCTTAASISLEGKRFWILRMLPVTPWEILRAKLNLNLLVGIPFLLLASVTAVFVLRVDAATAALMIAIPLTAQVFAAVFGLCANIMLPRFEWINEAVVIKQSGSVMLSVLGGMGLAFFGYAMYGLLLDVIGSLACMLIFEGVLLVLTVLSGVWLAAKGIKRFEAL